MIQISFSAQHSIFENRFEYADADDESVVIGQVRINFRPDVAAWIEDHVDGACIIDEERVLVTEDNLFEFLPPIAINFSTEAAATLFKMRWH